MSNKDYDKRLVSKSGLNALLEKLTLKHRSGHRWWSSPVVKNTELAKIVLNDRTFSTQILNKINKNIINFHPFKKIIIKQEEKLREIYIQNWVDKIVQLRIQEIISEEINPIIHPDVYSFQKGRGPVHAIEAFLKFAKGCKSEIHILQLDITKYGDNVDQSILQSLLFEKLNVSDDPLMAAHLEKILSFEIIDTEGQRISKKLGLPTGSPLVPLFENLYLLPVDHFIENTKPLFYCRYGDDMVIAYKDQPTLEQNLASITKEIEKIKLTIHPDKIAVTHLTPTSSFNWLGFKINGKIQTGSKETHVKKILHEIKMEIHRHFFCLRQVDRSGSDITGLRKSLEILEKKIYFNFSNRIFNFITSEEQTKQIDQFRIMQTHKAICKNFKLDKKMAWKLLRQTKHRSANQIRMHFLRKKQWPKVPLKK